MVQYATPSELASYLQQDVDTASALLALTTASAEFSSAADTWFASQSTTYVTTGTRATGIWLPFNPVIAVSAVRINTVVVTGHTLIGQRLYRTAGFGTYSQSTPDLLEIDLTYGFTTVPDDVKLAVLEMASVAYDNPTGDMSESIDDYTVRYAGTPITPGRPWRDVAAAYRGTLIY